MKPILLTLALAVMTSALSLAGGSAETDSRFPVLAWIGPPSNETTPDRYRELAACGFNRNYSDIPNWQAVPKALEVGRESGVLQFLDVPSLGGDVEGNLRRFRDHPGLGGYFLRDEPSAADFPELARWVKRIQAVDVRHPCYVNLFPNYARTAQLGTRTYQEYVDRFAAEVPVPFLSFDNYPVTDAGLRPGWYENLEVIAKAARKARKPFWAFALAVAHGPYSVARLEHLRLQAFSDLAYGAQGLQYFTYWTPKSDEWNFHMAPIDGGKRTEVYDRVRQVNAEVQALSPVFRGSEVVRVGHTGRRPPGSQPYRPEAPISEVKTEGEGAVVSLMRRGPERYLVIVNRDYQHPMPLTVEFERTAHLRIVRTSGTSAAVESPLTCTVDPGDVAVLGWAVGSRPAGRS